MTVGRIRFSNAFPLFVALAIACQVEDDALVLVGSVERTAFELGAPVSEAVIAILVERGERVSKGQALAQLDPTLATADLARAEAGLASARTSDRIAQHELERMQGLHERDVASLQDLDRAQLSRDEGAARLRGARAGLAAARKRALDHTVKSPVAGVVDQLPFHVGERVPTGAVLAVVLGDEAPWVRVWVPADRAARLGPGVPAEVRIDGVARALKGEVLDVAREPAFTPHYALTERDRVHLVYETRVRLLDAPDDLRPGVAADVRIQQRDPSEPRPDEGPEAAP